MPTATPASVPTVVLVHGAGHTATVWADVQAALRAPSITVDLPGRGGAPGDLATATVAVAAEVVVGQLEGRLPVGTGAGADIVLVGHSVAGTIVPAVAAAFGSRVRHLVFVAGIAAPEGVAPVDVFLPGQAASVAAALDDLRRRYAGARLEAIGAPDAARLDSLTYSTEPMRWHGLAADLPRTWVRCCRDPIQPTELQAAFVEHAGAQRVVDIDSGHTPAADAPAALAEIIDAVAVGLP